MFLNRLVILCLGSLIIIHSQAGADDVSNTEKERIKMFDKVTVKQPNFQKRRIITKGQIQCHSWWMDQLFLFFLMCSGLEKGFTLDVITRGQSTTIFLCIGPFSTWWQTNKRTNEQPGDPSASLLLTSVRRQSFAIAWLSIFTCLSAERVLKMNMQRSIDSDVRHILNKTCLYVNWKERKIFWWPWSPLIKKCSGHSSGGRLKESLSNWIRDGTNGRRTNWYRC